MNGLALLLVLFSYDVAGDPTGVTDSTQAFKDATERYRAKYPEKRAAQIKLSSAIATKKVHRPSVCSICGKPCTPHGHHPDYSKPLEVIWCCHSCHIAFHWEHQ